MVKISVITPTYRREDLVRRCVESVLAQEVDAEVEHVVVNDAGEPLRPAAWRDDPRVQVFDTARVERAFARNVGAALSRGDWLYFLDDDDYALPGAFAAMLQMARRSGAAFVYGGYQTHNATTGEVRTIRPAVQGDIFHLLVADEVLPTTAVWIRRDAFFAAGGFDPLLVQAEDVDLFRNVSFLYPVAGTDAVIGVARVAHPATTTTVPTQNRERQRHSLRKSFSRRETLLRLLARTRHDPYWRGRCARKYLGAALWSWRRRHYALIGPRLLAAARLSARHLGSAAFWRGLTKKAESGRADDTSPDRRARRESRAAASAPTRL